MNTITEENTYNGSIRFTCGSRMVEVSEHQVGVYSARLYVNNGETATTTAAKFKKLEALRAWARRVLVN